MLTGTLNPTAGDAFIDGLSILRSPVEIKQKIGMLQLETRRERVRLCLGF
jgi:ABC-type Na+ transport system ATPase subunit NatA